VRIGSIDRMSVHSEQLGFHQLNDAERVDMISYQENGDIQVKSICEDCQEALERNPNFHENQTFIQ
jgi:hypothetical protein